MQIFGLLTALAPVALIGAVVAAWRRNWRQARNRAALALLVGTLAFALLMSWNRVMLRVNEMSATTQVSPE